MKHTRRSLVVPTAIVLGAIVCRVAVNIGKDNPEDVHAASVEVVQRIADATSSDALAKSGGPVGEVGGDEQKEDERAAAPKAAEADSE